MGSYNHIRKVAIVGASGNLGRFLTEALLKVGKHDVTAISRHDSTATLPKGVAIRKVDYDKHETLVEALHDQDALVNTMSGTALMSNPDAKLVKAAGDAGVKWILPNEWSPDTAHEGILKDMPQFGMKVATRKLIEELGKSSYVAVVTGYWYEFCLAMPGNYGFDFAQRAVNLYDNGKVKISTSTWPQIGRAVAALLSLPIKREDGSGSSTTACLDDYKNRVVYINSFTVSQRDMLASALRVTSTKDSDWTITHESARERFAAGVQEVKEGKMQGFQKFAARLLFDDGCGDFESSKGTLNDVLGLPKQDSDQATKVAIERQAAGLSGH